MKHVSFIANTIIVFAVVIGLASCGSPTTTTLPGAWDKLGDFEGYPRSGAVSFVINNIAYVGTGFNYQLSSQIGNNGRLNDFWKYDPNTDTWTQVADFPGIGRSNAVGFSLNGKGYVGTGTTDGTSLLSDFYEYDPTVGSKGKWTRIADFGYSQAEGDTSVSARFSALAFTVKNRAFVGAGTGLGLANFKDLWEYDQTNNVWIPQPSIGGSKRANGFVMVINDIAYVGGGTDNSQFATDFYKFDVTKLDGTQSPWTRLNGLTGKDINGNAIVQPRPRELASTFAIDNFGYLVCGSTGGPVGDTWQYNPSNDTWIQYFSFTSNTPTAGSSRSGAVSFTLTNSGKTYGYLATGGVSYTLKFDDVWQFIPAGVEPDNK